MRQLTRRIRSCHLSGPTDCGLLAASAGLRSRLQRRQGGVPAGVCGDKSVYSISPNGAACRRAGCDLPPFSCSLISVNQATSGRGPLQTGAPVAALSAPPARSLAPSMSMALPGIWSTCASVFITRPYPSIIQPKNVIYMSITSFLMSLLCQSIYKRVNWERLCQTRFQSGSARRPSGSSRWRCLPSIAGPTGYSSRVRAYRPPGREAGHSAGVQVLEFVWLGRVGARTLYIESFSGKLRDELLDREVFYTLLEVRVLTERNRRAYNRVRPHSSLGYRSPAPEALLPADPVPRAGRTNIRGGTNIGGRSRSGRETVRVA